MWTALLALACAPPPAEGPRCLPAPAASPADLDDDGHPDLVFAQTEDVDGAYRATSPVYFGGADGFSAERRLDLPTIGADDVEVGDVDGDGWLDVVFASVGDGETRAVDSLVYHGGPDGLAAREPTRLPGLGTAAVLLSDADGDGQVDVFLANRYSGDGMSLEAYTVASTFHRGGPGGPTVEPMASVTTIGAADARLADLDQDGHLDLVVASGTFFVDTSRVYWGRSEGFGEGDFLELPTAAPEGVEVADWNGDGWLDLLFANFYEDFVVDVASPLYWGGPAGFAADRVTWIPTHGATDALAADLDGDTCAELVVANAMTGDFAALQFAVDAEVWSGAPGPLSVTASLPTTSAAAVSAGDLDLDGDLDLVFANRYDAEGEVATTSRIYWNEGGFDAERFTGLPTVGAAGVAAHR